MSIKASAYAKSLRLSDGINAAQKGFLMVLADYHNAELGFAWASIPKLKDDCCFESENTVRAHIRALEDLGILHVERRAGRRGGNRYYFLQLDGPPVQAQLSPKSQINPSKIEPFREAETLQSEAINPSIDELKPFNPEPETLQSEAVNPSIAIAPERGEGNGEERVLEQEERETTGFYPSNGHSDPWDPIKQRLKASMTKASYVTWLQRTHFISREGNTLIIGVPSQTEKEWLEKRLRASIRKTATGVLRQDAIDVRFVVAPSEHREESHEYPDSRQRHPFPAPGSSPGPLSDSMLVSHLPRGP